MDNALSPAVVDVPLGSLNQLPPDHAGPTGRLVALYDAIFAHYDGSGPKRIQIDPRAGFTSFSNVLRSSTAGTVDSGTWASPSFLFSLGDQLLSICSNVPRVWNGASWTNYGDRRIVTQRLSQSVLHAANATIAAPDSAWVAGVTCAVWTEQHYEQDDDEQILKTGFWVGFRADDGAWKVVPKLLWSSSSANDQYVMARVVQDGSRFWVFYNTESSGPKIFIDCYDTDGVLAGTSTIVREWDTSPGYWDVYGSVLAGVILAQPGDFNATPTDVHVQVTRFTIASGIISQDTEVLSDAHCMGPLAWLTNDLTGTSVYLATLGPAEGDGGRLWAYEIDEDLAITKEYDFSIFPTLLPDSITGWAEETGTPDERNVYVSFSQLAAQQSVGPPFDPALRYIRTVKRTFAGATTTIRTTQSVLQQSRAFAIDGEYHAYTYLQSGSGQALPSAPIEVTPMPGDYLIGPSEQPLSFDAGGTYGAPRPATVARIDVGLTPSSGAIDGSGTADSVALVTSSGLPGIEDGTPVLRWTFKNVTFGSGRSFSILDVDSSSIPTANFQWDIITGTTGGVCYTPTVNRVGGTVVPGNFTTTGTAETVQVAQYTVNDYDDVIPEGTLGFFTPGGDVTIGGAANPLNDGTFTLIERNALVYDAIDRLFGSRVLYAILTTQVQEPSFAGTAVVSPASPYNWTFQGEYFTSADSLSTLVVTNNPVDLNNGEFEITAGNDGPSLVTDATQSAATVAQNFPLPMPTAVLRLNDPADAFTLKLQGVTFDYTYIGALISITGLHNTRSDGVYKVTDVISVDTVRVQPTNGQSNQRSETIDTDPAPSIFIQLGTNVQPQTQPTWFVTPLTGKQPQVGMFEKGLAFADWRFDGETDAGPDFCAQNRYRFALSSTSNLFDTTRQVVLPFRASNFTQVSVATVGATPIDIANTAEASTVGLKIFQSTGTGQGAGDAGKLLIPGLLTSEFTRSGFAESNFNAGPEAPFIVSQEEDTATTFALIPGKTYTYQATVAVTLENGDVVESLPSPPIQVTMTGSNNVATIGGRLIMPLDSNGAPLTTTFGLTNHRAVVYKLFRSVVVDGIPSVQLHLITNPANPNGLYGGSGTGSGFTFPDSFTWNYRDENPDAGIRATEPVYAGRLGQGIAPHWPAPASRFATTWANRRWVVGYDGAVWMSAELLEGEDPWFFPGFRYPFPEEDPAVVCVGFENYLFIGCRKSWWRVPLAEFPNATLTAGSMPPPVRMPQEMGCTGFAVAMPDFVAYSSSVDDGRQVWAITRNLQNVFLSEALVDAIGNPVSSMAVDGEQKLLVAAGATTINVFDPVAREWSVWRPPSVPSLLANYQGQPAYQDSAFVLRQQSSAVIDTRNAVETPVAIDLTLSSLTFAAVRAVKRLWEAQIIGTRNGPCNINAAISYPDDAGTSATTFGPTAVASGPMLLAINPAIEDAGSWSIRIFGSYEGIVSPGRCFSLEMLSCEVGVDSRQGLKKLPNGFRLVGT